MASALIHICVAKKANEILNLNPKEFFLGAISPDISKQIGESKAKSHFLDNGETDVPNLERFLDKYKDSLKTNAFNLGYYCHLFADFIWFAFFMPEYCSYPDQEVTYIKNDEKRHLSPKVILKLLYNDYTNLTTQLIDRYELDLSLFYEEVVNIKSEIEEIPIDKLEIIVEKMGIIIKESKDRETIIFNRDGIERYIEKTAEDFIKNLKELNVIE